MNKSGFLKNLIFLFALACFWIFPHLFLSSEINIASTNARNLQVDLKVLNDNIERLVEGELKRLQNETRIVRIASDSIGLVRSLKSFDEISIDYNRVKQVEDIVNKEYD